MSSLRWVNILLLVASLAGIGVCSYKIYEIKFVSPKLFKNKSNEEITSKKKCKQAKVKKRSDCTESSCTFLCPLWDPGPPEKCIEGVRSDDTSECNKNTGSIVILVLILIFCLCLLAWVVFKMLKRPKQLDVREYQPLPPRTTRELPPEGRYVYDENGNYVWVTTPLKNYETAPPYEIIKHDEMDPETTWVRHLFDGKIFFQNLKTKERSWTLPENGQMVAAPDDLKDAFIGGIRDIIGIDPEGRPITNFKKNWKPPETPPLPEGKAPPEAKYDGSFRRWEREWNASGIKALQKFLAARQT